MAVDAEKIELSIIIPTRHRAAQLRACLEALNRQTQPASDWEVVVVVDGADDGTLAMLSSFAPAYRLRVQQQDHSGTSASLNRGVDVAAGCYCLFLGDDVVPDPDLVAEHLRAQRKESGAICLGPIMLRLPQRSDWYAQEFAARWNQHYAELSQAQSPTWRDCNTQHLSVPRTALLDAGGFTVDLPVSFGLELGYTLTQRGLPIVYLPNAMVEQCEAGDFERLTVEAERRGQIHAELCRRHPEMLASLLGNYIETTLRTQFMRRLLLACNVPPRWLKVLGQRARPGKPRADWFKFIEDYSYWRGVRRAIPDAATWQRLTQGTPILMYHAFGQPGERPSRYILPLDRFARQMAWLKRLGYHVLSLEDYLCYRREQRLPPAHSVVITVDDGYTDNYTLAYPILRRYGFPATIFLVSGQVGNANQWDQQGALVGRSIMSWTEIREMLRAGLSFGAHTRTHPALTEVSSDRARDEIENSRADLERELGLPIALFSYPHGKYNDTARASVEQAGFWGACSTRAGLNSAATPDFELRRTEVRGTDSLMRFILALWLGDDRLPPRRRRSK